MATSPPVLANDVNLQQSRSRQVSHRVDVGLSEQQALKAQNNRGDNVQTVIKLKSKNKVQPITADLDGWKVVAGKPSMKTWILHTSADGSMISGCWEAKPGTYHATYVAYEFVHLIKGKITITPDGGKPVNVGPGDAFVVEKGFKGRWKIREKVLKHFDIKLK